MIEKLGAALNVQSSDYIQDMAGGVWKSGIMLKTHKSTEKKNNFFSA